MHFFPYKIDMIKNGLPSFGFFPTHWLTFAETHFNNDQSSGVGWISSIRLYTPTHHRVVGGGCGWGEPCALAKIGWRGGRQFTEG